MTKHRRAPQRPPDQSLSSKKTPTETRSILVSVRLNGRTEAYGHVTEFVFYYIVFEIIIFIIVIFIFSFINRVWKQREAKMSEWVWLHFLGNIFT